MTRSLVWRTSVFTGPTKWQPQLSYYYFEVFLGIGITPEHPWFIHNDKKYFVMFDPPHLIKSVRNNLMKYSFRFGQHVATWKDIEDLYMKDSALPIRSAPKLTEKHIHPTNFNKMRVKLATQVLSHTVAASLCTYASLGGLPSTAMGTSEFLSKFDSVFDCVNCSTLHSTKNLKCPLNDTSPNKKFMKEAIIFIKKLKVFNGNEEVTGRIKCLKGWAITLSAILAIWDHLKANHAFKYILTRRLNTDPIENFFGTIRQQGGNNDNPTPVQFVSAFRKLFFSSFLTSSAGNCAADFDDLIAQCTENKESSTSVLATTTQPQTLAIGPTDYKDPSVVSNIVKENAITYVAGYLLHKCSQKHSCSLCKEAQESNDLDDSKKLLCYFKAYNQDKSQFGGLHVPSASFLKYIVELEAIFFKNFSIFTKSSSVGGDILKLLKREPVPFQYCDKFPLDYLQKLFLRMRIYYSLKFANRDLRATKRRDRKYLKVSHL